MEDFLSRICATTHRYTYLFLDLNMTKVYITKVYKLFMSLIVRAPWVKVRAPVGSAKPQKFSTHNCTDSQVAVVIGKGYKPLRYRHLKTRRRKVKPSPKNHYVFSQVMFAFANVGNTAQSADVINTKGKQIFHDIAQEL